MQCLSQSGKPPRTASHLRSGLCVVALFGLGGLLAASAAGQVSYTFTSGPYGDGFDWPASPMGLPTGGAALSLEGMQIFNGTGNTVYFDGFYVAAFYAPNITADAVWCNPTTGGFDSLDFAYFSYFQGPPAEISFDLAWSVDGSPTPDEVRIYVEDPNGRATDVHAFLDDGFTGPGGISGYAGHVQIYASDLFDSYGYVDGEQFTSISWLFVDTSPISAGGPASEVAVDNFDINGGAPVGDWNNDRVVDFTDFTLQADCTSGPGLGMSAGCEQGDYDEDADVDMADMATFMLLFG